MALVTLAFAVPLLQFAHAQQYYQNYTRTYAGAMTYWGCWTDSNVRSLSNMTYQSDSATIESCTSACADGGYLIAGLEDSNQCFCGESLRYTAAQANVSSCSSPCAGDATENCGGPFRLSIFSNGRPVLNEPPNTPATIDTDYRYVGCYTDNLPTGNRTLSSGSRAGSFMTLEYCAAFCQGYRYFGTEYSSECYCGNTLQSSGNLTSDNDCSMMCADDNAQICGAGNRLTVYENSTWITPAPSSASPSAASTPTASAISCPTNNGTIIASGGKSFVIECDMRCDTAVDVSYSGVACYLKSVLTGPVKTVSGTWGAWLANVTYVAPSSASASTAATTAVQTATQTSATPSVSAISCPASNGTTYVTQNKTFAIECGVDHQGGDLQTVSVGSSAISNRLSDCIAACANVSNCVDVSLSGVACYLKSSVGAAIANSVWGARLISPLPAVASSSASLTISAASSATPSLLSCPSSNGTNYTVPGPTASSQSTFVIECGVDHFGGVMSWTYLSNFSQCVGVCGSTTGCVDVSLSGAACYLKASLGKAIANSGIWGARLLS